METAAGTNESVFDKFLSPTAEPPPTPAPETPATRVTPVTRPTRVDQEAAPQKDFTRTPNSLVRDAVPAGLFTGKGKQLYDYLYQQTRGAVVPKRSARLPREKVMRGAKMSRPTFRTQLSRLVAVGLVKVEEMGGDHLGNLYTVYLPEEAVNPGYPGSPAYPGKELDGQPGQESYPGNPGLNVDFQRASGEDKTLNTRLIRNDDDEAYADFISHFNKAFKEITGREPSAADRQKLGELAEVLTTELRIAAGRTTVSSVPAFLAEHLRRRLWKKDKRQLEAEAAEATNRPSEGQQTPGIDASQCPDCFGGNYFYPEGYEKGVARCRHEKLTQGGEAG